MTKSRKNYLRKSDKFYEAIISSALMFRTYRMYGTYEKAINALTKRKPILEAGSSRKDCERYFKTALKVVDDGLKFEKSYIRRKRALLYPSVWFDAQTIEKINKDMERYLKIRNPRAPSIFLHRCIARIYYFYHLR